MSQDWTPVTLSKTTAQKNKGLSSAQAIARGKQEGIVNTERKQTGPQGLQKLEDSNDEFAHKTVSQDLSKAIMQARMAKKMTQQQLGNAINEKAQVIQQYEQGKAIPNPQILNKVNIY